MSGRVITRRLHLVAGLLGFFVILAFWTTTVVVELVGSTDAIIAVKQAIPWGLLVLVPALAISGASGFRLAGRSTEPRIVAKKHRMPVIAGIGLVILVPSVVYLAAATSDGHLGVAFYAVQTVELIAGGTNLALMSLNIRDGLRLTGRLKAARVQQRA